MMHIVGESIIKVNLVMKIKVINFAKEQRIKNSLNDKVNQVSCGSCLTALILAFNKEVRKTLHKTA